MLHQIQQQHKMDEIYIIPAHRVSSTCVHLGRLLTAKGNLIGSVEAADCIVAQKAATGGIVAQFVHAHSQQFSSPCAGEAWAPGILKYALTGQDGQMGQIYVDAFAR